MGPRRAVVENRRQCAESVGWRRCPLVRSEGGRNEETGRPEERTGSLEMKGSSRYRLSTSE